MNRMKILGVFVVGVLAITITAGAVVYRSASASPSANQAADTSGDDATSTTPSGKGPGDSHVRYSDDDLAVALGITVDELTAAKQKAHETALAQAVEKGLITQAQADELTTNGTNWKGWVEKYGLDNDSLLAEALGITVEKLQAAYTQANNTSIDQAVTDGTLTQEQADLKKGQYALRADKTFLASMQTAFEAAVKQAVENGVITQAQADQILANASSKGAGSFLNWGDSHGPGGGHGGGRHGSGHSENAPVSAPAEHLESETATP
jgi:formaldehyde-activating enzyme involved in methanogenesis